MILLFQPSRYSGVGMQGWEHFLNENLQNIGFNHFLSSLYKSRELQNNTVFLFGKMKNV